MLTVVSLGLLIRMRRWRTIRKQASWLDASNSRGHWPTSDGDDVEFDDGGVVAFELKAHERATGTDFGGSRKL